MGRWSQAGEKGAGERGRKMRRRARKKDVCGREVRKEACMQNFIRLLMLTVAKSKLFTWKGKNEYF